MPIARLNVKLHLRDGRTDSPSVRPSLRWSITVNVSNITMAIQKLFYRFVIPFSHFFCIFSSGGFKGGGGAPPYWLTFLSKSRFFPCKSIYFVVRIWDEWGWSW